VLDNRPREFDADVHAALEELGARAALRLAELRHDEAGPSAALGIGAGALRRVLDAAAGDTARARISLVELRWQLRALRAQLGGSDAIGHLGDEGRSLGDLERAFAQVDQQLRRARSVTAALEVAIGAEPVVLHDALQAAATLANVRVRWAGDGEPIVVAAPREALVVALHVALTALELGERAVEVRFSPAGDRVGLLLIADPTRVAAAERSLQAHLPSGVEARALADGLLLKLELAAG
jgi:hypothetical protein